MITGIAASAIVALGALAAPADASASAVSSQVTTGRIAGVVTGHGHPIQDVCIRAINVRNFVTYQANTSSTGHYTVHKIDPGRYYVLFVICPSATTNWLSQWYKGLTTSHTGVLDLPRGLKTVQVKGDKTTTGINAAMQLGASITGQVTSAATGIGIPQICITAVAKGPNKTELFKRTVKGGDGRYGFHGLFPAKYRLEFFCGGVGGNNFVPQWWKNAATAAQGTPIKISGTENFRADVKLTAGGMITGTVHSTSASGPPIAGICVTAADPAADAGSGPSITGSDGTYHLAGLPAGSYTVTFDPFCGEPTASFQGGTVTAQVTVGTTTSGVDGVLQPKS